MRLDLRVKIRNSLDEIGNVYRDITISISNTPPQSSRRPTKEKFMRIPVVSEGFSSLLHQSRFTCNP